MINNVVRPSISGERVSPLPAINTMLPPHRDDMDPIPSSQGLIDFVDSDYLGSGINSLYSNLGQIDILEMARSAGGGEECFGIGSSFHAEEVRQRVETTAAQLNISMDPERWSQEDVLNWLRNCMRSHYSSPGLIDPSEWMVDGRELCAMTQADFIFRLPKDGQVLHTELDLWKTLNITSGYSSIGSITDLLPEDVIYNNPSYVMLESAENFPTSTSALMSIGHSDSPQHMDHKYQVNPSVLQADPNLQQVTVSGPVSAAFDKLCWENLSIYGVVKSEQTDEIQSTVDDNSWLMHNSVTSSTNFYTENKPKLNGRGNWSFARGGPEGVSSGARDQVATSTHRRGKRTICLWQFLKELLHQPMLHSKAIRWLDRDRGVFKIEDSQQVAKLWGDRKNRPMMNYDKLSRSIRQYYRKGIIQKTSNSKRLVYQFCPEYL